MDMNFIFSWSTRYLTRSLRSLVRYRVDHSKIKFIFTRGHVISSISHSFASLSREILFLPLEHKIHIFSPPFNILYIQEANIASAPVFCTRRGSALYLVSHRIQGYIHSPRGADLLLAIFKMAAMLQIPRVFPWISCLRSAKAVQCPVPGQKLVTKVSKSRAIPPYAPGVNPPGMAANK